MTPVSEQREERSRKNYSAILTGLGRVGQVHAAATIGVHESTVSKMKDGELQRLAALLAACDLKVVSNGRVCVRRHEYQMMTQIVSRALANQEMAERLLFEDPE